MLHSHFLSPIIKIIVSNNIISMDQPKCSSAMVGHNNSGTEGGFPGFPTIINTSPMPSPSVNFMFPKAEAKEEFSSSDAIGSDDATKDINQVPDAKIANSAILNANSGKVPLLPYSLYRERKKGKNIMQSGAEGENPTIFWTSWGMRPENGATEGSMPFDAAVENGHGPIRRNRESFLIHYYWPARPSRHQKVVVDIESPDINVPDDGYCWRKYGQKKVKGNSNPRSYYRCTTPECYTKKHVERAAYDARYVITTYEGKHNHDVPFYRRTHKITFPAAGSVVVDRNATIPILESQELAEINNEFLKPNNMDGDNDMNNGSSDIPVAPVPLLDLNLPPPEEDYSSLDEHDVNGPSPMGPEA